jgi:hypothetical protein
MAWGGRIGHGLRIGGRNGHQPMLDTERAAQHGRTGHALKRQQHESQRKEKRAAPKRSHTDTIERSACWKFDAIELMTARLGEAQAESM